MAFIRKIALGATLITAIPSFANALAGYSTELTDQFTGWCTGEGYTAQVCGCAVSKAAVEIPAVAMASYLAAVEGQGTATVSTGVGATALQVVTTCAAMSSSGGGGNAMKSLGGLLGN